MLTKCLGDPYLVVSLEALGISDSLSYEKVPFEILDRQVHWLQNKDLDSVKVLWQNHKIEEATWEAERT